MIIVGAKRLGEMILVKRKLSQGNVDYQLHNQFAVFGRSYQSISDFHEDRIAIIVV